MSLYNKSAPFLVSIALGSLTADGTVPGLYLPREAKIRGAWLMNGADIAADNTNYCQVSLLNGSDVIAEIDTRAAHENGLTANVAKALNLVAAEQEQLAASSLKVTYNEEGTFALTSAVLILEVGMG